MARAGQAWATPFGLAAAMAVAMAVVGCTTTKRATLNQLRARSAFDLGCPPVMLRIHDIDELTRGVAGCGRRLSYVETCELVGGRRLCTWVSDPVERPVERGIAACPPAAAASFGAIFPAGLVCSVPPSPAPPAAPATGAPLPWAPPAPPPALEATTPPLDPFEDRH